MNLKRRGLVGNFLRGISPVEGGCEFFPKFRIAEMRGKIVVFEGSVCGV
jgi:hypothetical protein